MNITVERRETGKTVRVFGDINRHELTSLKTELKEISSVKSFIVDLTEADFAGTDFINMLAELRRIYSPFIRRLTLRNPNELIQDLLDISQLSSVFAIEHTVKKEAVLC